LINKFLKNIHNFLLLFGLDVRFVQKEKTVSHNHNTEMGMDKFWEEYNQKKMWKIPEILAFYNEILQIIKTKNILLDHKNIVDLGCGTGSLLYFIDQHFKPASYTGLEFSNKAIEIAKVNFPRANYYYFDILKSEINEKFDFLFCTEVLEHIDDPYLAINNIQNLMATGSVAFITVPNGRVDNYPGHINFWSLESWDVFVKKFTSDKSVETGYVGKDLYALIQS